MPLIFELFKPGLKASGTDEQKGFVSARTIIIMLKARVSQEGATSIKRTQELGEETSPMTQTKRRALVSAASQPEAQQLDALLSQPTFGDEAGHALAAAVQLDLEDEDVGADEGNGGAYPDAGGGKDEESKDELDAGDENAEQDNADQENADQDNAEESSGPIGTAWSAFTASFDR